VVESFNRSVSKESLRVRAVGRPVGKDEEGAALCPVALCIGYGELISMGDGGGREESLTPV